MKKEILRMCIVCKTMQNKKDLLRIVKNKNNDILLDNSGKADGRGAYVCNTEECIEKLQKTKALNRAFKTNINDIVYDAIKQQTKGKYIDRQN